MELDEKISKVRKIIDRTANNECSWCGKQITTEQANLMGVAARSAKRNKTTLIGLLCFKQEYEK